MGEDKIEWKGTREDEKHREGKKGSIRKKGRDWWEGEKERDQSKEGKKNEGGEEEEQMKKGRQR